MSHPVHLLAELIRAIPTGQRDLLKLKLVAYPRTGKKFGPTKVRNLDDDYDTIDWHESVLEVLDPDKLEHQVQTAVFKLVRSAPIEVADKLQDLEWGVSTDMGSHFIPAADLQSGLTEELMSHDVIGTDVARRFRRLFEEVTDHTLSTEVKFFKTGHGFHAYACMLLPINLRERWLKGLEKLSSTDKKWVAIAQVKRTEKDDQGVLRWSAGSDGRCAPTEFKLS